MGAGPLPDAAVDAVSGGADWRCSGGTRRRMCHAEGAGNISDTPVWGPAGLHIR